MKLITRDTDYAVRALCYIAGHKKKTVSAAELVKKLKIPRPFLRKILQVLQKEGILRSYKGKGGGFQATAPLEGVLLVDVIKVFQGPLQLNECVFKKKLCPNRNRCTLRKKIIRIEERAVSDLEAITIGSLR